MGWKRPVGYSDGTHGDWFTWFDLQLEKIVPSNSSFKQIRNSFLISFWSEMDTSIQLYSWRFKTWKYSFELWITHRS